MPSSLHMISEESPAFSNSLAARIKAGTDRPKSFMLFPPLWLQRNSWAAALDKSYKLHVESSKVGLVGALKKLGYWAIIAVAFELAGVLQALCVDMLGVELDWLYLLGWWVLASLIINEARSILENLVELGYDVPQFLVDGLAVTQKLIEAKNPAAGLGDDKEE